jgi:hypothetical protein
MAIVIPYCSELVCSYSGVQKSVLWASQVGLEYRNFVVAEALSSISIVKVDDILNLRVHRCL